MSPERRKHRRLNFEVPVDVKSGHFLYLARTTDISEGGVFLKTAAHLRLGASIHLRLQLDQHAITVIGRVAWRKTSEDGETQLGLGVQFDEMSPYAQDILRGFMRTHGPGFYGQRPAPKEPPRPRRTHGIPFRVPPP